MSRTVSDAEWKVLADLINEIAGLPEGQPVSHRLYDHLDILFTRLLQSDPPAPRLPMQARPTTYRGIAMRSRLEATYAASLDDAAEAMPTLKWEYEPRAFANRVGQYLPDFVVRDASLVTYVEVRPTIDRAKAALESMQIIWDSEPQAFLEVWTPDGSYTANPFERQWKWVAA